MCGGGSKAPAPAPAPKAPKKTAADVQAADEAMTAAERSRADRQSTILGGADQETMGMEKIKKKKLMGVDSEKLGQ
jgi:hypothetical protein